MTNTRAREAFRQVRKEEILDAAMAALADRGGDVSLNEIAKAAGLTRSALYRYFPSREELTRAAFTRCFETSKLMLEQASEQTGSPTQALRSLVEVTAAANKREGAREGMVLNLQAILATAMGGNDTETPVINLDMIDTAKRLAEQARESREFRDDVDPQGVALLVVSALQGLQLLIAMFGDDIDSEATTDALLSAIESFQSTPAPAD